MTIAPGEELPPDPPPGSPPLNPLDELDFSDLSIPDMPDTATMQAMMEAPVGVFMYLDTDGDTVLQVELDAYTDPGVPVSWALPLELTDAPPTIGAPTDVAPTPTEMTP